MTHTIPEICQTIEERIRTIHISCFRGIMEPLFLISDAYTRWMDRYGFSAAFDVLCEKYLEAWTRCYDKVKLDQELDPFTGEPSAASEWYSSGMLFYLYAAKRCGKIG